MNVADFALWCDRLVDDRMRDVDQARVVLFLVWCLREDREPLAADLDDYRTWLVAGGDFPARLADEHVDTVRTILEGLR
jgi:hypothetical protein